MSQSVRILYVDDYPLDRELVRDALEKEHGGFEVVEAASRADFETKLALGGFDLILSDFNILGFEGLQVLEVVHSTGSHLPVIIVTGTGSEEIAAEAIKRGAADYVLKSPKHIQHLPHTIRAVLENKRLEGERQQAEQELRDSEDKFKYVFDYSAAGKSLTLPNGKLNVNQSFCEMLGYPAEELNQCKWQEITHPEDVELTLNANQAMLSGEKEAMRFSKRFIHKNGSVVWADVSTSLRRDRNGKPLYFMTTFLDITRNKQAEEKLKEYSDHLGEMVKERTRELDEAQEQLVRQEKLAVLGQIAGSVSHELRNPLGVINTSIYYLKLVQPDANEKIKHHHAMIQQEVHNAEKIISDLLDFVQVKTVEREAVAVFMLVRQTLECFPVSPSVEQTLAIPEDLPAVNVDPRQVVQVLGNLVTNACQAMTSVPGVVIDRKLTFSALRKDEMVAIAVKDTGTGITPENMQKLFEPLFTTKARGIGLGLAVSKKLAEANGGRIEVHSEPGVGSTFTLVLPVEEK
jgi:PAS domain S-box-containing protein